MRNVRCGRWVLAAALAGLLLVAGSCNRDKDKSPVETNVPRHPGWRMAVLGDSREGVQVLDRVVMLITLMEPKVKMAIHLGDMIREPGNELQWAQFHDAMSTIELDMPLYAVPGNHDVADEDTRDVFLNQFELPGDRTFYRVDQGGAHLIFLDSEMPGEEETISGNQLEWLKKQLTELAGSPDFKLIFCHYPFFRVGPDSHEPLKNSAELRDLFKAAGVQAVFSSHDHIFHYEKRDGISYFITGGAGAPLLDIERGEYNHFLLLTVGRDKLWVQAVDLSGNVTATVTVPE